MAFTIKYIEASSLISWGAPSQEGRFLLIENPHKARINEKKRHVRVE